MAESAAAEERQDPDVRTTPGANDAVRIIEELYERRHTIKHILVATINDAAKSYVDMSQPVNLSGYAHLWRAMDVKLDRIYSRGLFTADTPPGPPAGVQAKDRPVPRAVRRAIEAQQRKVKKRSKVNGQALPE